MSNRNEPWRVSIEEFKALDVAPNAKLIETAKHLSAKLGRSTGHKEASLYLVWAHKVGAKKCSSWWKKNFASQ